MAIVDSKSEPISLLFASAAAHEITLVKQVVNARFTRRPTGDKAYDSDLMDRELKALGTELNAPHRAGRKSAPTQESRKLRSYKQRWKVER